MKQGLCKGQTSGEVHQFSKIMTEIVSSGVARCFTVANEF